MWVAVRNLGEESFMPNALPELSPQELSRYSRHIRLEEIGIDGQRKLAAARALVVGMGGLGSPAALYLAAAGVGTIGLADLDRVEEHNLQRQIVHETSTVGQAKVESAAHRLAALNPQVRIRIHPDGVTPANAVDLFSGYDVVVDGSDNFPTRYLCTDAAFFARRPLVHGSIFKFEGQVAVFDPGAGGPCYRCLFPEPPPGGVLNCGEAGVLGALCGVIGSLQATETIKYLLRIGESLCGRLLVFDALTAQFRTLNVPRDPDCPLCGRHPRIRRIDPAAYAFSCAAPAAAPSPEPAGMPSEVSVEEARQFLEAGTESAILLDVRESFEIQICRVDGSRHIAMREVAARLGELPRGQRILVLCHHGNRSRQVADFLRAQGFQAASNVAGGIAAWAERIDPTMRRY